MLPFLISGDPSQALQQTVEQHPLDSLYHPTRLLATLPRAWEVNSEIQISWDGHELEAFHFHLEELELSLHHWGMLSTITKGERCWWLSGGLRHRSLWRKSFDIGWLRKVFNGIVYLFRLALEWMETLHSLKTSSWWIQIMIQFFGINVFCLFQAFPAHTLTRPPCRCTVYSSPLSHFIMSMNTSVPNL